MNSIISIRDNLQETVRGWRHIKANPGAWLMQQFVLNKGAVFTGRSLPADYPSGTPKYCFANAQELIQGYPNLTYVEGFAVHPDIMFTFHHAWTIDENNQVVDPTLSDPQKYQYMGVMFSQNQIDNARTETSISVLDGHGVNVKLMLELDPSLALMDTRLAKYTILE